MSWFFGKAIILLVIFATSVNGWGIATSLGFMDGKLNRVKTKHHVDRCYRGCSWTAVPTVSFGDFIKILKQVLYAEEKRENQRKEFLRLQDIVATYI